MVASWFKAVGGHHTHRVRRPPCRSFVAAVTLFVGLGLGAACSAEPDPTDVYCATVERTSDVMAYTYDGSGPSSEQSRRVDEKQAAMAELRDVAPAELRGYWDDVVADDTELAQRTLARERIATFEDEHC
jgi:hypothetical protein